MQMAKKCRILIALLVRFYIHSILGNTTQRLHTYNFVLILYDENDRIGKYYRIYRNRIGLGITLIKVKA